MRYRIWRSEWFVVLTFSHLLNIVLGFVFSFKSFYIIKRQIEVYIVIDEDARKVECQRQDAVTDLLVGKDVIDFAIHLTNYLRLLLAPGNSIEEDEKVFREYSTGDLTIVGLLRQS